METRGITFVDMEGVTGSIPVAPTRNATSCAGTSARLGKGLGKILAVCAAFSVTGCAALRECREHPVACAVTVVAAGVVATKALEKSPRESAAPRSCYNLPPEACR